MSSSLSGLKILLLSFLFFMACMPDNIACSYAYQYSVFPLGSSGGQLIFLEVELERYVNTPSGAIGILRPDERRLPSNNATIETRWKGNLRLKSLTDNASAATLLETLAYIDISDESYENELAPYFEEALQKAYALPYFEEASLISTAYCRYDRACSLFSLQIDTIEIALKCALETQDKPSENQLSIDFPPIILQKFENITQLNFSEIDQVEKASRIEFFKVWRPYEAREYSIGGRKLIVYTLGWGLAKGYKAEQDPSWEKNIVPVDKFIEGKDVMMHGQRFDSIQFL